MEIDEKVLESFRIDSMTEQDLEDARVSYIDKYGLDIACIGADMQRLLVNFHRAGTSATFMDLILTLKERQEIRKDVPVVQSIHTDYEDNREYNF